uniref:Uncharacterized protein n=1 Tax=Anser cygnoides TaxID=8845 RepID=A0A8B9DYX5_ANSCY
MGHCPIMELLLPHGTNPNPADADRHAALSVAALCVPGSWGYSKVVRLLLEHGAYVEQRVRDGWTQTTAGAAYEGHTEIVELLLEASTQVDEVNVAGHTALLVAATVGHRAVVSLLLHRGADRNLPGAEGWPLLYLLVLEEHPALDARLHPKQALELQFEGPTCSHDCKKETLL